MRDHLKVTCSTWISATGQDPRRRPTNLIRVPIVEIKYAVSTPISRNSSFSDPAVIWFIKLYCKKPIAIVWGTTTINQPGFIYPDLTFDVN